MAESLLNGHLYLEYDVDERLLAMDNPYDYDERDKLGVDLHWDHAFYNGHYYMYFGIVPVLILFIPFRLLFGRPLLSFHATQFFTFFIIFGFFVLFRFLKNKFFQKMNEFLFILLTIAFSLASVWYFVEAPALYCTAISSAVCMMIWSLSFYLFAVFSDISYNKKSISAVFGAICGALCFGCRPTVAIANIIAVPLFFVFLSKNKLKGKERLKVLLVFLPYIIIGIALMLYNYARFNDPFEFGQSYQITFYDQKDIGNLSNLSLQQIIDGFKTIFFEIHKPGPEFPYVQFGGILFEFPIFIIGAAAGILSKHIRNFLKKKQIFGFYLSIHVVLIIIAFLEILMSPIILERYHSDFYFLFCVQTFLIIGCIFQITDGSRSSVLNFLFILFALITAMTAVLLFFVPNDLNYTQYYGDFLDNLRKKMPRLDFLR